jgi:hypothetical protein
MITPVLRRHAIDGQRLEVRQEQRTIGLFGGCDPQILRPRSSRGMSLEPVFVMESAQDWRCRDSEA